MSLIPLLIESAMRDPMDDLLSSLYGPTAVALIDSTPSRSTWGQVNQAMSQLNRLSDQMNQELQRAAVRESRDKFEVNLDCRHFKPEEINVKLVGNNLVVEAKHEERSDEHGFISRQFTRRYVLPEDVQLDRLSSKLGVDGTLSITAPKRTPEQLQTNERRIPITLTNQVFRPVQESGQQNQQQRPPTQELKN